MSENIVENTKKEDMEVKEDLPTNIVTEFGKEANKGLFIFDSSIEALSEGLFKRLSSFRDNADEKKFFVMDRSNSIDFLSTFKDSLFHYMNGIILCERLYFSDKIYSKPVDVTDFSDETKKLHEDFLKFSENIDNEDPDVVTEKINEFTEKINNSIDDTRIVKRTVPVYVPDSEDYSVLVKDLSEYNDDDLKFISMIISDFVISFIRNMFFLSPTQGLEIRGLEYEDYIDIIVVVK